MQIKKAIIGLTIITYRGPTENDLIHFEQSENRINQYLDNEHTLVINDLAIQGNLGQKLLYADGELNHHRLEAGGFGLAAEAA